MTNLKNKISSAIRSELKGGVMNTISPSIFLSIIIGLSSYFLIEILFNDTPYSTISIVLKIAALVLVALSFLTWSIKSFLPHFICLLCAILTPMTPYFFEPVPFLFIFLSLVFFFVRVVSFEEG